MRLLSPGSKLRIVERDFGWGMGKWVMGIKENMWCHEHWVLYWTDESLNIMSKTNDVL